jgi:purine-binding chemotaxis protein CheW
METLKKSDEGTTQPTIAGRNEIILPLSELIAEIDSEIVPPFDSSAKKEKISPISEGTHTSHENQYIQWTLEKTLFALPLSSVLEIGRHPDITRLPNLPNWVLGISNIRGEIISFIDLKKFLGINSTGTVLERRFFIIHNQDMKVGIIVDKIMGILFIDNIDANFQNSPYREGEIANYILGVSVSGEYLSNILDINKILASPRMTGFKES